MHFQPRWSRHQAGRIRAAGTQNFPSSLLRPNLPDLNGIQQPHPGSVVFENHHRVTSSCALCSELSERCVVAEGVVFSAVSLSCHE